MKVELVGFNNNFEVEVKKDLENKILHILEIDTSVNNSLVNVIDINNNQDRIVKKMGLHKNEWDFMLYSLWNNSVYKFENDVLKEVIDRNFDKIFIDYYNSISRKKNLGHYITKLNIENLRHLSEMEIVLSTDERKHLILTGKNGSGKTSVLLALKKYLHSIEGDQFNNLERMQNALKANEERLMLAEKNNENCDTLYQEREGIESYLESYFMGVTPDFNTRNNLVNEFKKGNFILAYFDSKRVTRMIEPEAIKKINSNISYSIDSNPGNVFVQYLVNLKAEQAFANQENDIETVEKITKWFNRLELNLQDLFESKSLKINFDFKSLNIYFKEDRKDKYSFNTLSDGFSSVINIVSDLILRMENNVKIETSYDVEGIVLIDEIETHLHVSLQKKILPFLINLFPNLQFIVTSHSPFVLSSISNAIIYDLENRIRLDDLSGYSYEGIIESYFNTNQYGEELIKKLNKLEVLLSKEQKNEDEKIELIELDSFFRGLPDELSEEAKLKYYTLINSYGRWNF
ncbi:AAA family ATPase [Lysinibacillus sp. CD3-6]|uniref:AAA family ATPase n=1 Tax=Lysinibacillus sp. CD3-6 TaxID=2892541 RepID=UPI00116AFA01|nr:AAA family ATPase [Lysinibacillus sp. CD3-6]UED79605.1 AAA family ATPase [Lysinibacillus sp. CD3-6]